MTTNAVYGLAQQKFAQGLIDWVDDTIKMILVSGYSFNQDTHEHYDDVSASEISASGPYSTGGATLGSKTDTYVGASNQVQLDSAAVTWAAGSLSATGAIIYKDTGTPSTSPLICFIDFEGTETSVSADFTVTPNASGWVTITTT